MNKCCYASKVYTVIYKALAITENQKYEQTSPPMWFLHNYIIVITLFTWHKITRRKPKYMLSWHFITKLMNPFCTCVNHCFVQEYYFKSNNSTGNVYLFISPYNVYSQHNVSYTYWLKQRNCKVNFILFHKIKLK